MLQKYGLMSDFILDKLSITYETFRKSQSMWISVFDDINDVKKIMMHLANKKIKQVCERGVSIRVHILQRYNHPSVVAPIPNFRKLYRFCH